MARKSNRARGGASPSSEAIRQQMEETRLDLANRLNTLKDRVLEVIGIPSKGGKRSMAEKRTTKKAASSAAKTSKAPAKKATAAATKKAGAARSGRSGSAKKSSKKTTISGIERKAKQVLGKALKGAAEGAVRGAVAAVVPAAKEKKSKKQEESDQ